MISRFKISFLFLQYFIFFTSAILSQNQQSYGLKFFNYINIPDTNLTSTSLNLNPKEPFTFKNEFTLQFDLSIWDVDHFGLINYLYNSDDFYIALLYSQHEKNKKPSLILSVNGDSLYLLKDFKIEEMIAPYWANITLHINYDDKSLTLLIDTTKVISQILYKSEVNNLSVRFGYLTPEHLFPLGLNLSDMIIKNVKISLDNKQAYSWPMDEIEGDITVDTLSGYKAIQRNGKWVKEGNVYWKYYDNISFNGMPCIAYDDINKKIYFASNNYLTKYSINDRKRSKILYANKYPYTADKLIYNTVTNNLMSYYRGGEGEITIFNTKTRKWSEINTKKDTLQNYYYHTVFVNSLNGEILTLGGYGFYTAKNNLRKYNFIGKKWEEVNTIGDYFSPRSGAAIGYGKEPWEIYVFSGFGNSSGKQESGFNNLNDLYLLDLRNYSFKKLWGIDKQKFNTAGDFSQMILDTTRNVLYALFFDGINAKEKTNKTKLYEISISDSTIKEASEYLPEASKAFLTFNKSGNRFITTLLSNKDDKVTAKLFSLKYPPESYSSALKEQQSRIDKFNEYRTKKLYLFIVITVAVLLILLWLFRSNISKLIKPKKVTTTRIIELKDNDKVNKYDIRLFGDFIILAQGGDDISSKFSPKLSELFLLVFIYTYHSSFSNNNKGISTEKMTNILWPDFSQEQAKNIRGVTLNHLREILNESTGIKFVYESKLWRLDLSEELKIDVINYLEFKNLLVTKNFSNKDILSFVGIFNNGGFLMDKSYPWLDPVKISTDEECINILNDLYNKHKDKGDYNLLLALSDAIMNIDSVNEEGLRYKLSTLSSMNKNSLIRKTYKQFTEEYKRLYDEHYPKLLDELI